MIFFDHFTRSDSPALGEDWWNSGNWEIKNGELRSNGIGRAVATTRHPVATVTGYASAYLKDLTGNRKYRVYLNADATATDYEYAEFEVVGGTTWLRCGTLSGGMLDEKDTGPLYGANEVHLSVCRNRTGLYAETSHATDNFVYSCLGAGTPSRRYAGVAAMMAGTHDFDTFVYREHDLTNNGCEDCFCSCDYYCIPRCLLVTIESLDLECDCLDGKTFKIWYLARAVPCVWTGDRQVCDPFNCFIHGDCSEPNTLGILFGSSENISDSCFDFLIDNVPPTFCSCNPVYAESAVRTVSVSWPPDGFECQYRFIITDAC